MDPIADRLFNSHYAQCELEEQLEEAGVPVISLGWDHYDCSLELHNIPPDYRLSTAAQDVIRSAGFAKVYVNHTDKWETHYTFRPEQPEPKGWRVSYPHRRGDNGAIWVEEICPTWPQEWFKSGRCVVKSADGQSEGK